MKMVLTQCLAVALLPATTLWAQAQKSGDVGAGAGTLPTDTLMVTGDPAPDGNGNLYQPEFAPTINNKGEVAVVLGLSDTAQPNVDDFGVYLFGGDGATKMARAGEPVPNGNGIFKYFAYDLNYPFLVAVNDFGSVAFSAELDDTSGVFTDNSGLFGANATDGVTEYVRISDPAPDGNGIFGLPKCCEGPSVLRALSPPGLDNDDQIAFHGYLTETSGGIEVDDFGIFVAGDGSIVQLLRLGQPEPFGSSTIDRISEGFGSNPGGEVAIGATVFTDFRRSDDGPPPPPADLHRIYVATESLLQEGFVSGAAAPDGDGIITGMSRTRIAENGHLTFLARDSETADIQILPPGLFSYDGVTLKEIVRQGELAPGETEPFRFEYFRGIDSNNNDEVAFSATVYRPAVPPDNRTTAIYRWSGDDISVAVHQGDAAPDGNGTFGDVAQAVFLNDYGQIAFAAQIENSTTPPSIVVDTGIFLIDASNTVHQVARAGQMLAGTTVRSVGFLGSNVDFEEQFNGTIRDSDLRLAGMNGLNNSGQVPFVAGLGDGTEPLWGLFRWPATSIFASGMEDGTLGDWDGTAGAQ